MNRYHLSTLLAYLLWGLAIAAQPAGRESPEILLERAIQKQTVDGDLKAAIEIYKKILERTGRNRAVEAKALLRLGQCQEKLGQTEAVKAYERLARDYADHATEASAARARLAALKAIKSGELTFQRLHESPIDLYGDAVSYHGRYLLTTKDAQGQPMPQLHDLATGEVRKIPWPAKRHLAAPFLSPDGSEFGYATWGSREIRIARVDGAGDRVLYEAPDDVARVYPYGYSPDGKQHLIYRRYNDSRVDFALLSAMDGSLRVLKTAGHYGLRRGVAFSPDSRFIAYDALATPDAKSHDIHVLSIESGQVTVLVDNPADDSVLAWAPNGSGILMRSDRTGTQDAYFQPMRGIESSGPPQLVKRNIGRVSAMSLGFTGNGRFFYRLPAEVGGFHLGQFDKSSSLDSKLTFSQDLLGAQAYFPAWSVDGSMLAFRIQPETGPPAIGIKKLPSGPVAMLPAPIIIGRIDFLRDDRSLVLAGSDYQSRRIIGLLDIRTGQWTTLKESGDPATLYDATAVSPDGKYLYFADSRMTIRDSGNTVHGSIVRMNLATREEQTVLDPGGPFSLSPDGRSIAFVDEGIVQVFHIADRSTRKVGESVHSIPAWSPDGRSILFQRNLGELWRVSAEGGSPVQVALLKPFFNELKIHPDGRQIAIIGGWQSAELWVADNLLSAVKARSR